MHSPIHHHLLAHVASPLERIDKQTPTNRTFHAARRFVGTRADSQKTRHRQEELLRVGRQRVCALEGATLSVGCLCGAEIWANPQERGRKNTTEVGVSPKVLDKHIGPIELGPPTRVGDYGPPMTDRVLVACNWPPMTEGLLMAADY